MLTKITGVGAGSAPVVNLTFPFLEKDHVKATVNGSPVGLNWTGASQVTFASAVAAGAAWVVYRDTPISAPEVDFENGAVLTADDLDRARDQLLYREQELEDGLTLGQLPSLATLPRAAPQNLLSNTQWEIMAGFGYGPRWKADGSGTLATCNLTGNDAVGPLTTLVTDGVPAGWKVGDFIKVDPYTGTLGHDVGDWPLPIIDITGNNIITRLPMGVIPGGTGTGTITNMNVGGSASAGTGDAADGGWKKTTTTKVWREDNAVNLQFGALYALGVQKGAAGTEVIWNEPDVQRFRGRQIVFGGRVKHNLKTGSGTFQLALTSDGTGGGTTYSQMGTAFQVYEYLEVSATIPADATFLQVQLVLLGANGDTYHFINPMLSFGDYLGPNSYTKPAERLIPIVKIEPLNWINATINFPATSTFVGYDFVTDFHVDSGGMIARSVRLYEGSIEGINTNAVATGIGGSRLIGWIDTMPDPIKTGPFMSQQVQNVKCHQPLRIPLVNGTCRTFSGVASDVWSNVSIDFDLFHLE